MPGEHGKGNLKREGCSESCAQGPAFWHLGASSRRVCGEHMFIPSSQPRDTAGNGASNLSGRLQLPVSHTGCTPLFLSLSLRALHRGRLKRVLSSWATCPQRKKGRRCLKYWQSSLFAARKKGNVSSGAALEMEVGFPCGDQQSRVGATESNGAGSVSKLTGITTERPLTATHNSPARQQAQAHT